ncbi:MAG TPA: protein kinase [Acidobacteriota bacterium]|nr:protein kinase [Acidobacteriota bacterium]
MGTRGRTLQQILEAGTPLLPDQVFAICVDIARILENYHKQNKVYGGIYPDQIQIEADGFVQIFELAAPRLPDEITLSYLCFLPPEIFKGSRATVASDIYSFGVILYSLLTGRIPFDTGSHEQLLQDIQESQIKPLPILAGNANQADRIIKRCMNVEPLRRYQSAQDVLNEIRSLSRAARPLPGPNQSIAPKIVQRSIASAPNLVRRHKYLAAGIAAAVLLAAGFLFIPKSKGMQKIDKSSWLGRTVAVTHEIERDPSLSPAGDTIAYVANITGNWEIYLRPTTGGNPTAITQSPGVEENPKWSPDGNQILFTYKGPGVPSTLFIVAPSGGIPQKIADHAMDGQWSPDGTQICYVTPPEGKERSLIVLDWKDQKTRTLLQSEKGLANPSFSPGGDEIVAEADIGSNHGLLLIDVDSGEKTILTKDAYDQTPSWSWVTHSILFSSNRKDGFKIWKTDRNGKMEQVTQGKGDDFHPTPAIKGTEFVYYRQNKLSEIHSINPESIQETSKTTVTAKSFYPRIISRDSFAFLSEQGTGFDLKWGMDGSTVATTVMQSLPAAFTFAVSQDGSFIFLEQSEHGLSQINLKDGSSIDLGSTTALPYETSPDKKMLFYAVRRDDSMLYRLRDLKTQQEDDLFIRPDKIKILRSFWLDNSRICWLAADGTVSLWSIKENKITQMLKGCYDFAIKPHSETAAALIGNSPEGTVLELIDFKSGKRVELKKFDQDGYARNLDWSRDGKLIYYDRFRKDADLYIAE